MNTLPEFLQSPFSNGPHVDPLEMLVRLAVSLVFGFAISLVYRATRRTDDVGHSFPATIVLLCVLIAMVTQVIGDNVARAFSLVGALSIVRFRTVVRDTQDTAYVILSVIVGMAVGAKSLWVALIGLCIVAIAEMFLKLYTAKSIDEEPEYLLRVRCRFDCDLDAMIQSSAGESLQEFKVLSAGTAKDFFEASYRVRLRGGSTPAMVVKTIKQLDGIKNVELVHRNFDGD